MIGLDSPIFFSFVVYYLFFKFTFILDLISLLLLFGKFDSLKKWRFESGISPLEIPGDTNSTTSLMEISIFFFG